MRCRCKQGVGNHAVGDAELGKIRTVLREKQPRQPINVLHFKFMSHMTPLAPAKLDIQFHYPRNRPQQFHVESHETRVFHILERRIVSVALE